MMWKAAKATYPQEWERQMRDIKNVNLEAYKYLMQIPPRFWSKSRFTPGPKCDTLLNNMSKAFNSVIVGSRAKPIVTMLEEIRVYLMERWAANRQKIAKYEGSILPRIKKRLQRECEFTNVWMPRYIFLLNILLLNIFLLLQRECEFTSVAANIFLLNILLARFAGN